MQGFPEYGPERMGAPIRAYNRISDELVPLHCNIEQPDIVVVLDPTLVKNQDVLFGIPEDGVLLVNSPQPPSSIRAQLGEIKVRIFTLDASGIAVDTIGRDIPNTPMMGALVRISGLLPFDSFMEAVKSQLEKKFPEDMVRNNIAAIERAYQEVSGEDEGDTVQ